MPQNSNVHAIAPLLKTLAQLSRSFPHSCSHIGVSKLLWCHWLAGMSPKDFAYILHVQKIKYKANVLILVMYKAQVFFVIRVSHFLITCEGHITGPFPLYTDFSLFRMLQLKGYSTCVHMHVDM